MNETSTTAMLVGSRDMLASREDALAVTLPRDDVQEALTFDPPADLMLDVFRAAEDGDIERRTVKVAWSRADLESLLTDVEGEAITFSFDRAELERALDEPDVESHGLREAAVVLSIAAAAAVGTASTAAAEPGGAVYTPAQVAVVGHDEASLTERGIGDVGATHDEATLAARGVEAGTLAASHDEATLAARGVEAGTLAATHDEATLVARGITAESPAVLDSSSGFDFPSVDSNVAAGIAGALAGAGLLIAAAAFATRRREPGPA